MSNREIKKILAPFRSRIRLEAICNSLIAGLIAGFIAVSITVIVNKLSFLTFSRLSIIFIALGISVLTCVVTFIIKRPRQKDVAVRLDEYGMKERTLTMLEYAKDNTYISSVQRADAIKHISEIKKNDIKIRFPVKKILVSGVITLMMVLLSLLPFDNLRAVDNRDDIKAQMDRVDDMIQELKDRINEADVNDEVKEELESIVDKLEKDIKKDDTRLEKVAKISEASDKIDKLLKENEKKQDSNLNSQESKESKELNKDLKDIMDKAKEELLGDKKPNGSSSPSSSMSPAKTNNPSATKDADSNSSDGKPDTDGQPEGDGGPKGYGESDTESSMSTGESAEAMGIDQSNEEIYDAKEGRIPYDEVYGPYYSEAIDSLDKSDTSKEDSNVVESYFDSLK